nr:hypothetical protein [Hoylesella enoeca]
MGGLVARRRVSDQLHALDAFRLQHFEDSVHTRSCQIGRFAIDVDDSGLAHYRQPDARLGDDARQFAEYVCRTLSGGQHVSFRANNHAIGFLQHGWRSRRHRHFTKADARLRQDDRARVRVGTTHVDRLADGLIADQTHLKRIVPVADGIKLKYAFAVRYTTFE